MATQRNASRKKVKNQVAEGIAHVGTLAARLAADGRLRSAQHGKRPNETQTDQQSDFKQTG